MLSADPKKLRLLGIDMHARGRRRSAVVLTYGVYLIAMGWLVRETRSVPGLREYYGGYWLMLLASSWVMGFSFLREGGAVKRFKLPVWRVRGEEGGWVLLRNLDDWAKYNYGDTFDALPEERQQEVLRKYRVGNYFFPASGSRTPDRLDEREVAELDRASKRTLTLLCTFCFSLAGAYAARNAVLRREDVAAVLFTLGTFAMSGPKASILWNEPDPRIGADLKLVQEG